MAKLALAAVLACAASALSVSAQDVEADHVSLVQSIASIPTEKKHFETGQHVLVQLVDEPGQPWVKGSVSGKGADPDTYNIYIWEGPPNKREHPNMPVELVFDAVVTEILEEAQKKENAQRMAEETKRRLKEERERLEERRIAAAKKRQLEWQEQRRVEKIQAKEREETARKLQALLKEIRERQEEERQEAERQKAEEERKKAEAERVKAKELEAEQQTQQRRKVEAENAAIKAAEDKKREEEEATARQEAEIARMEKERLEKKAEMKAHWEKIKHAKLEEAGALDAPKEVQRELLMSPKFKEVLAEEKREAAREEAKKKKMMADAKRNRKSK